MDIFATPPRMDEMAFARFRALILREAGIHLGDGKVALLAGRLARRLRELGMDSYREYYARVEADEAERVRMLDAVTTNETHFFREPAHFRFLAERVFPAWKRQAQTGTRPRAARVWSAACSTGEEPFSLAMLLRDHFGDDWSFDVLASDLSTRALESARAATWPMTRAAEIPLPYLKRFMLRGVRGRAGTLRAEPELRAMVRFARVNLDADAYSVGGPFDLVFCRNVLIYFHRDRKQAVVDRLASQLAPGGHLFVGHAESLQGQSTRLRGVAPTVYALVPEAA